MVRLPDDVSRLLRASWRLDKLGIDELLTRAQNIQKDIELVAAAAKTTETLAEGQHAAGDSTVPKPQESLKCYRCGGLNYYSGTAKASVTQEAPMTREQLSCYCCNGLGPCSTKLFRKWVWGQDAITSLALSWPVNRALPVIKVHVDGVQCLAINS